jgi:hypothetical protein
VRRWVGDIVILILNQSQKTTNKTFGDCSGLRRRLGNRQDKTRRGRRRRSRGQSGCGCVAQQRPGASIQSWCGNYRCLDIHPDFHPERMAQVPLENQWAWQTDTMQAPLLSIHAWLGQSLPGSSGRDGSSGQTWQTGREGWARDTDAGTLLRWRARTGTSAPLEPGWIWLKMD